MAIKEKSVTSDSRESARAANRERQRRFRASKKLSAKPSNAAGVTLSLPADPALLTKQPLTSRLMFLPGRGWFRVWE